MEKTIRVQATWEFDVDISDLLDEYVDAVGLAKDLTKREMEDMLSKCIILADDFSYSVKGSLK